MAADGHSSLTPHLACPALSGTPHYGAHMDDSSTPVSGYHEQPEVMQLHRTIGGYITVFSELTAVMRRQMGAYMAPVAVEVADNRLLDVLFASMTAKPLIDSFFAMSTEVGGLDEQGLAIRRQLRRRVDEHISFRNDIAHSEWSVGWEAVDTGERIPPTAHRIKSFDGVPRLTNVGITANGIVQHINAMNHLREAVLVFGRACRARQCGSDVGVSSVLALGDETSGGIPVRRDSGQEEWRAETRS